MILIAALGLACVHLFAGKLRFLGGTPRSAWLSLAAGVSVSYVFLFLLPELSARQHSFPSADRGWLSYFEHHVYVAALIGLTIFYGLERASKRMRQPDEQGGRQQQLAIGLFWSHMLLLAFYNALLGYLLVRDNDGIRDLVFFSIAMAFHLLVMDRGLRDHYQHVYHAFGRWLLSAALLVGWGVGKAVAIPEPVVGLFTAFVAGGIILNVLKDELPEHRQSRFSAFTVGALGYSVLLLAFA